MSDDAVSSAHPEASAPAAAVAGTVAVIGAGAMGLGIAQVAATAGHPVALVDAVEGAAERALARLAATMDRLVQKARLTREEADGILARVTALQNAAELPECALVIEAVPEDLELKQRIFADLAAHQPATTLLASNTSSLSITDIAQAVPNPERVLGLHFFNPPPLMRLVEVIHGDDTAEALVDHCMGLMRAWGKTPVRCSSTPGFIVNRVARPYYGEGQRMVAEGICDAATLDWVMREKGGFRMGPMELADFIGHDVNYAVGESVWQATGQDERYAPTDVQGALVRAGDLGRKTGQGFYGYDENGASDAAEPDTALAERLVGGPVRTDPLARTLAMLVNEAVDLVHRGEASADDVDVAMRLGVNYPRGPIDWGREIGFEVIDAQIRELDKAYPGGRYRPSPALTDGSLSSP